MHLRILMLGWLVCFYAFAVPTVDEIKATSGKQQIVLLNAYLKEQSSIDARQALALLIELKPNLPLSQFPEQRLELQLWEGVAQKYLGNEPEALSLFNTVINESQQSAFTAIKLQALRQRSFFHSEQTNHDLALSDALEVYKIVENSGDLPAIANAQNTLAGIYFATDQFSKAYEWFLKAEDNYRLAQDRHGEVIVWGRIGSMYRSLGDFDAALSYQLRTIEGLRQLDSDKGLSIAFNNTGIIYKDLGKYPQAIDMHLQSLELKQKIGYERGMVYSFNNLGETYRLMGDVETAKRYLREAELLANKLNNRMLLGSTYLYLGRIAITEQQYQDAESFLDTAMNTYRQRNSASRIAEGLVEQARLLRLQGQNPSAIEKLKEAIDFAQRAQKNVALFNAYELLAQTYADVGDYQSAFAMQQTYQASRDALFDSNSQQRIEMLVVQNQVADTKRNL